MRSKHRNEFTVLVTGFGPYPDGIGGHVDVNTSYTITTILPHELHANTSGNPSKSCIRIITLPHPVKTEYKYAREFCKMLHDKYTGTVDLYVHLGEARGWDFVTVERVAYKEGMSSVWWTKDEEEGYYTTPDDAGKTIKDAGPSPWDKMPMGLRTALSVDSLIQGASSILQNKARFGTLQTEHPDMPKVQAHDEGGPFLCGFINYESLANRYARGLVPNVLFCHIPGEADEKNLSRTREAVLAIIASAVNEVSKQDERICKIYEAYKERV